MMRSSAGRPERFVWVEGSSVEVQAFAVEGGTILPHTTQALRNQQGPL